MNAIYKTELILISPSLAESMLGHNKQNRKISKTWVKTLAASMKAGQWQMNGQTIVFEENGRLADGQHRLLAIIESGVSLKFLVVRGAENESMKSIDTGRNRSGGDVLHMMGIVNANAVVAVMQQIFIWVVEKDMGNVRSPLSKSDCAFAVERIDIEFLLELVRATKAGSKAQLGGVSTFLAAIGFIAGKENYEKFGEYIVPVLHGENIQRGDPAFALREWMYSHYNKTVKAHRKAIANVVARTWLSFYKHERVSLVKYQIQYNFPEIPVGKNFKSPW
jgi:hypothetical protein